MVCQNLFFFFVLANARLVFIVLKAHSQILQIFSHIAHGRFREQLQYIGKYRNNARQTIVYAEFYLDLRLQNRKDYVIFYQWNISANHIH